MLFDVCLLVVTLCVIVYENGRQVTTSAQTEQLFRNNIHSHL